MAHSTMPLPKSTDKVVTSLAELEKVKGILCFGSYAVGTADEHSDLDLYVLCEPEIVSKTDRKYAFESAGAISDLELEYTWSGGTIPWIVQQDRFRLNGVLFDVAYNTARWIRAVVMGVAKEGKRSVPELTFRAYTMLGLLENSIVLYDHESLLKDLLEDLHPYPKKLKDELIAHSLGVLDESLADLADYQSRGIGNTGFLFHLNRMNDALCTLLFAVNEKYDPASKRVEHHLAQLKTLPTNFLARYAQILAGPFDAKGRSRVVEEYKRLVAEVKQLAKHHS